jgi:predicted ATPase
MRGLKGLLSSLPDRMAQLPNPDREAPPSQQSLNASLEWSHGLLDDPATRAVFRRLAVFAGSPSPELIQEAVADPPGEGGLQTIAVLNALTELVERSLVAKLAVDDISAPRFRLPESHRPYALARLREAKEDEALKLRHARAGAMHFDASFDQRFSGDVGIDTWLAERTPACPCAAQPWCCVAGTG